MMERKREVYAVYRVPLPSDEVEWVLAALMQDITHLTK